MFRHDLIRLAACLAHSAPGVTLELVCCNEERLVVTHHRLDADFSPCELRTALIAEGQPGIPQFADVVIDATITVGLRDLGGGLYEGSGDRQSERWFATLLDDAQVVEILESNPFDMPEHAVDVQVLPDRQLGVTAVRIVCVGAFSGRVDEVAAWALAACMVVELIADDAPVGDDPSAPESNIIRTKHHPNPTSEE
jgi:hypothetical protein